MKCLRGFTLIELLIVVAIIAILAAIAVPNFMEAQVRAKVSRCMNDMRTYATALESYRVDLNKYPTVEWCNSPVYWEELQAWSLSRLTTPVSYISSLPSDPFLEQDDSVNAYLYVNYEYEDQEGIESCWPGAWWEVINDGAWTDDDNDAAYTRLWVVKGLGPDRTRMVDLTIAGINEFQGLPYNSSNGTVSIGDIVRLGP